MILYIIIDELQSLLCNGNDAKGTFAVAIGSRR